MKSAMENLKPCFGQILVQSSFAGLYILSKLALDDGMNNFVFVAYRQAIATLVLSPFAYFLEKKQRPQMTWVMLFQIFLLSCGVTINVNCYAQGVYYTSSTFLSVAVNMVPIVTYVMAIFVGLEQLDLRNLRGQAKVVGTIVCVTGAMVMTFYKGAPLTFSSSSKPTQVIHRKSHHNFLAGTVLIYGGVFAWSAWLTFQGPVVRKYPAKLSITALTCFFSAVQSALVGIICNHNKWDIWVAKPDIQLISVVYAGVICSAIGFFLQSWCIARKGPVFAGIFCPFSTIITALFECIILGISLRVGSVVGALLIILGLYAVLWGKSENYEKFDVMENKCEDKKKSTANSFPLPAKEESNV